MEMSSLLSLEEEDEATSSMDLEDKKVEDRAAQEKLVNLVSWLTNKIDKNVEEMQAEIAGHMKDTVLRFAEAETRLTETNNALAVKAETKVLF